MHATMTTQSRPRWMWKRWAAREANGKRARTGASSGLFSTTPRSLLRRRATTTTTTTTTSDAHARIHASKPIAVKLATTALLLVVGIWGPSIQGSVAWADDADPVVGGFVPLVVSDADDTALVIIQEGQENANDNAALNAPDGLSPETKETQETQETQPKKPLSRRGRIKELEDIKAQLAVKELELLSKENALFEKEQSISVLRQELEIERKLRDLIIKEKEDAEEEALLSKSLCTGSTMLP